MKRILLTTLCTTLAAGAPAIETTDVQLRGGESNDGAVTITRDTDGNLVLDDVYTNPIRLIDLLQSVNDHGSLTGISDDDHLQYLNAARHGAAHDVPFDMAMPIGADANGNTTIGAHVLDATIHLNGNVEETIGAPWDFEEGIRIDSGSMVLGPAQYGGGTAMRFEDGVEDAEFRFGSVAHEFSINRAMSAPTLTVTSNLSGAVGGVPSAALSGFTSVEGIAPADLLSAAQPASIAAPWSFLDGATVEGGIAVDSLTLTGLPSVRIVTINAGAASIAVGNMVQWSALTSGKPGVTNLSSSMSWQVPFAGVALNTASQGQELEVAISGIASSPVSDSFAAGALVTWDGAGLAEIGEATGYSAVGVAVEASTGSGSVHFFLQRVEIPAP